MVGDNRNEGGANGWRPRERRLRVNDGGGENDGEARTTAARTLGR
jgi:hypothetical protein